MRNPDKAHFQGVKPQMWLMVNATAVGEQCAQEEDPLGMSPSNPKSGTMAPTVETAQVSAYRRVRDRACGL